MQCPLPIDWLDWLDQPTDPPLREHLDSCRSCQALVALLRRDEIEIGPPNFAAAENPISFEATTDAPREGELWLTGPAETGGDRALVLTLDERHREFGRDWFEVAAADTAIEKATDLDLLLRRDDTNIGVPLRLRLDLQGYVAAADLTERAGRLTEAGRSIAAAALHETVDESRWGVPIEGPYDERLIEPDCDGAVVRQLQMRYRACAAAAEDPELTLAAVLNQARTQRGLSRAELAERLAEGLDIAPLAAKVKRYYADLENGLLSPSGLRPALVATLGRTLGVPWQRLDGLRDAFRPPASAGAATVFARSASTSAKAAGEEAAEERDVVDDLFLGGGQS